MLSGYGYVSSPANVAALENNAKDNSKLKKVVEETAPAFIKFGIVPRQNALTPILESAHAQQQPMSPKKKEKKNPKSD